MKPHDLHDSRDQHEPHDQREPHDPHASQDSQHNRAPHAPRGSLASVVSAMVKIGLIGFGGGNALVPVIERELVTSTGILPREEFDKEVIVANITPGALPVEIASGAGRSIAGIPGMILAAVGMALPGAALTFFLLLLFSTAADSVMTQVRFASVGIAMLIVVLLVSYALQAIREKSAGSREQVISLILMLAVFVVTGSKKLLALFGVSGVPVATLSTLDVLGVVFFAIFFTGGKFNTSTAARVRTGIAALISLAYLLSSNAVGPFAAFDATLALRIIMLAMGVVGFFRSFKSEHGPLSPFPGKRMAKEIGAWAAFLVALSAPAVLVCPDALRFAGNALLSVLMSFGGGDAYLVFGQGLFVDTGMIPADRYFEQVVTASNAMPGSIIAKVLTGVGFVIGSEYGLVAEILVALCGFACGVGASGVTFLVVYYIYERFEPLGIFQAIKRYIRPVIGGLLLTIAVTMFSLNMNVASAFDMSPLFMVVLSLALFAAMFWAGQVKSWPLALLIVCAIAVSLAVCNIAVMVM